MDGLPSRRRRRSREGLELQTVYALADALAYLPDRGVGA